MLTINRSRLLQNLTTLAEIGATPAGGVTRLALSETDLNGRAWFQNYVQQAGLTYAQDGAGNQSAVYPCANPHAQTLMCGSHLDSVTNGGRYDGALGVLAALEVAQTIQEAGLKLPVHLEVINFTDEEGTLLGELGSLALTGQLTVERLLTARGGQEALQAGLARLDLTFDSVLQAKRDPAGIAGFVELHIEQGKRLESRELNIGVVTTIVGIRSWWLTFTGTAGHGGSTPMNERQDALWGAAAFVHEARQMVIGKYTPGVMNCGSLQLSSGAFNLIPASAHLSLEFRHGSEQLLGEMERDLLNLAHQIAHQFGLQLHTRPVSHCTAAPSAKNVVQAIEQAAEKVGCSYQRMMSFAGHDTQTMALFTPSAMIFVPSVKGISHHPQEFTQEEDIVRGANVLLHTILSLAQI